MLAGRQIFNNGSHDFFTEKVYYLQSSYQIGRSSGTVYRAAAGASGLAGAVYHRDKSRSYQIDRSSGTIYLVAKNAGGMADIVAQAFRPGIESQADSIASIRSNPEKCNSHHNQHQTSAISRYTPP